MVKFREIIDRLNIPQDFSRTIFVDFDREIVEARARNFAIYNELGTASLRSRVDCFDRDFGPEGTILLRLVSELETRDWNLFEIEHPDLVQPILELEIDGRTGQIASESTFSNSAVELFGNHCSMLQQGSASASPKFVGIVGSLEIDVHDIQERISALGLHSAILTERTGPKP